jgi:hypothetical protein
MSASIRFLAALALVASVAPLSPAQPLDGDMRFAALGGASAAARHHAGPTANPASLPGLRRRTVTLFAGQGYGMHELRTGGTAAALPVGRAVLGIQGRAFGFDQYRETWASAEVAGAVFPATSRSLLLGARLRYHHTAISDYGNAGTLGLSLGIVMPIAEGVDAGAWVSNLNQPAMALGDPPRSELIIGIALHTIESVSVYVDAVKDPLFPLSLRGGAEFLPVPRFALRVGTSTYPETISAGAGMHIGDTSLNIAAERHRWLGWTPGISASVTF